MGALDGKHIAIQAPPNEGSNYFNYKGFHSVVLLAACDASYKFTLVDVGAGGRFSDGGVFRGSTMGQDLVSGSHNLPPPQRLPNTGVKTPMVFVGDEAFPLLCNLMRPFPRKDLTVLTRVFNYRLSRARRIIENAFGILVARWRIFRQPIHASLQTVDAIIWASVCLHNYLRVWDDETSTFQYCPRGYPDGETASGDVLEGRWRADARDGNAMSNVGRTSSNMHATNAKQVRETYCKYFCSSAGEVPWQYEFVYRGSFPNS